MKNHPPIYMATVNLNKQIHMQALGFTFQAYKFVCANSPRDAEFLVHAWAVAKGLEVKDVTVGAPAWSQDASTYTFPEQILNLPKEVLDAEYARREYPEAYRDPGQYIDLEACHG